LRDDGGTNKGDYMKLSLRVILILGVAITLVTFVVARNQVRSEKQGLRSDLEKRVETLAESLEKTVEPVAQKGAASQLSPVVERFASREHLAGIAVFDELGRAIAASSKLPAIVVDSPDLFAKCISENRGLGTFRTIGQSTMYGYALPLHRESEVAGVLVVFYDASYIEAQSARIWRDALWHVVAQGLLVILIIIFVIRWTIVGPITRMARWMRDLRHGKVEPFPHRIAESFLGPLSAEAVGADWCPYLQRRFLPPLGSDRPREQSDLPRRRHQNRRLIRTHSLDWSRKQCSSQLEKGAGC
jgi:hypothetical protein